MLSLFRKNKIKFFFLLKRKRKLKNLKKEIKEIKALIKKIESNEF